MGFWEIYGTIALFWLGSMAASLFMIALALGRRR